ncbi:MAG: hypothetical protein AAGI01_06770, partial [Myxococcota bacterium]
DPEASAPVRAQPQALDADAAKHLQANQAAHIIQEAAPEPPELEEHAPAAIVPGTTQQDVPSTPRLHTLELATPSISQPPSPLLFIVLVGACAAVALMLLLLLVL